MMYFPLRFTSLLGLLALGLSVFASGYKENELLVKYRSTSATAHKNINRTVGAVKLDKSYKTNWWRVKLPAGTNLEAAETYFRNNAGVLGVSKNPIPDTFEVTNDPMIGQQWQVNRIKLTEAWDISIGDPNIKLAILDTGYQMNHPDLQSQLVSGWDFGDGDSDPTDIVNGHGTHVAGLAAAATDNGVGGVGVGRDCKILPVKVFGNRGGIAVVDGIIWAADQGAKVISMSLGISDFQALRDSITYALDRGVFIVAAAGNDNATFINYPAGYPGVMAVASSDPDDTRSGFSTYGNWVHVAAPGNNVLSTVIGSGYGEYSGTSMSCPVVAGLAGLIFARGGASVTNVDVFDTITENCDPVPGDYVIHGRVNALESVLNTFVTVTNHLDPVEIELNQGTDPTGNLESVKEPDGDAFTLKTIIQPQFASLGSVDVRFILDRPFEDLVGLGLTVRMNSSKPSTAMLWLWNNHTEEYDYIKAWPVKSGYQTKDVKFSGDMSHYFTATGEARGVIRSHVPLMRNPGKYTMRIDVLNLMIQYQQAP